MGFALAAAIVFDAFIVRMVLIPALLYLMDEKAWWMPAWLDKILPNVDVEGEKLQRPHLAAGGHALSETDLDEAADDSDVLV
jgi:RND superfamily putative drug exporter